MVKAVTRTLAVGALIAGGALIPASAAQAAPTGCVESYVGSTQYKAKCGTPYPYPTFYVRLVCDKVVGSGTQIKLGNVATTNAGTYSTATCSSGYEATVGTVEH
ncbi:hypothetical protein QEZ54_20635 [Catellatospora sp. KI3]|uniref:hypothetical protein n=1 Tax=Catellatospora sp. KI3 TaxID=3041620 RepID=UPI002482183B|nr:hypothetical protein [Catellatospora sp. KI3]MDI1463391.1 hypothetical protein [Catellatospora sp. KI3]